MIVFGIAGIGLMFIILLNKRMEDFTNCLFIHIILE